MEFLPWYMERFYKIPSHEYHLVIGPWCGGLLLHFSLIAFVRGQTLLCCSAAEVLWGCQWDDLCVCVWEGGERGGHWARWAPRNWLETFQNGRQGYSLATSPRLSSRSRWWYLRDRTRFLCHQLKQKKVRTLWTSAEWKYDIQVQTLQVNNILFLF